MSAPVETSEPSTLTLLIDVGAWILEALCGANAIYMAFREQWQPATFFLVAYFGVAFWLRVRLLLRGTLEIDHTRTSHAKGSLR